MAGEKDERGDTYTDLVARTGPVTPLLRNDEKAAELSPEAVLPDGGWGWFVVLGSFLAHLLIGGFMRSGGVIFLELQHEFHRSATETAWAVSLHTSLRLLFGPLASMLCNRFSCRKVAILGSVITAASVLVSGFAPNLTFLYFTNGLLPGIGQALMYTTSVAIVGLYFHKRRGTAVGIANAGVGAGTFLFPPLVEIMFNQYGFTGTFLILAALFLNGIVCGTLYRPLDVQEELLVEYCEPNGGHGVTENGSIIMFHFSREDLRALSHSSLCYDINILGSLRHLNKDNKSITMDFLLGPGHSSGSPLNIMVQNGRVRADSESRVSRARPFLESDIDVRVRTGSDITPKQKHTFANNRSGKSLQFPVEEVHKLNKDVVPEPEVKRTPERDGSKRKLLDLSPLKDVRFATLGVGIGLLTLSFQSSFVFLPPLVLQKGMSEIQGAYLVSITGAMETFGSVSSGFLVDLPMVRPHSLRIYNAAMILLGVLTLAMPFIDFFILFAFVCGVYGCVLGMCLAQKATLVVDITGVSNLVSAFGILVCFQGIGTLIGPPLAGCIKDITGRYQDGFIVGGSMLLAAGLIQSLGLVIHRVIQGRKSKD